MGLGLLILFSIVSWATEPKQALELLEKTQAALQKTPSHCYVCDLGSPPDLTDGLDPFCEDLFGSVCLDKNENTKAKSDDAKLRDTAIGLIEAARDSTAKAMGFQSFDGLLNARLKSAGLEVVQTPPKKEWSALKKYVEGEYFGSMQASKLFAELERCQIRVGELGIDSFYSSQLDEVKAMVAKAEPEAQKIREKKIELYARNLPYFMSSVVSRVCERIDSDNSLNEALNQKAFELCRKRVSIRRRAVELFRKEKTDGYLVEAKKFVEEFFIPDLASGTPGGDPEAEVWKTRLHVVKENFSCSNYASLMAETAKEVFDETSLEVNHQKVMLDSLVDSFFPSDTEKSLREIFEGAKADAKEVAARFVPKKKLASINSTYNKLDFKWKKKLPESVFRSAKGGGKEVDEAKLRPVIYDPLSVELVTFINDPSLSYFFTRNAAYMPKQAMGEIAQRATVHILPAYILKYKVQPYDLVATISHEVGHHLGPEVSRINGYNLSPQYKGLVACLSDAESISLRKVQEDEAIADFISAEIIALQLEKIDAEKRRPALAAMLDSYCHESSSLNVMCHSSHPENSLRVSGIYGANPNLRKVVGCNGPSSKYKSCGIQGAVTEGK